jgi:hypothetical protein
MRAGRLLLASALAGAVAAASVPAVAYWTASDTTELQVSADRLTAPVVTAEVHSGSSIRVRTEAGPGPAPERYEVSRGGVPLCPSATGPSAVCDDVVDGGLLPASRAEYSVMGRVGDHWVSPVGRATAVTAPPTPTLGLRPADDTGTEGDGVTQVTSPTVLVTAAGGGDDYNLTITVNGVPAPPQVVPRSGRTVEVPVGPARPGGIAVVAAVAVYEGARSEARPLTVRVVQAARPASLTLSDEDDRPAGNGENPFDIHGGDTATIAFTGPVDPDSLCPGWDGADDLPVTVRVTGDGGRSVLTVHPATGDCGGAAAALGTITLNHGGANPRNPVLLDFPGSTVSLTSENEISVTMSPGGTGLVWRIGGANSRGHEASFDPASTLLDVWGHPVLADRVTTATTF